MNRTILLQRRPKGGDWGPPLAFTAFDGRSADDVAADRAAANPGYDYRAVNVS